VAALRESVRHPALRGGGIRRDLVRRLLLGLEV
jgi:hypothetical protein